MATIARLIRAGIPPTWARMLGRDAEDNITATGATQGTAYQITKSFNNVTGGALNTGLILPAFSKDISNEFFFMNNSGSQKWVYPAVGEEIAGFGVNNPAGLVVTRTLYRISETKWIGFGT